MNINQISQQNKLSFNSSYEYRQKRAVYVREQLDDYDSHSILNKSSEGLIGIGLFLLAFDKINTSLTKLKMSEKFGYAAFITGAIMQFILMFKHSSLSLREMKEYDRIHKTT